MNREASYHHLPFQHSLELDAKILFLQVRKVSTEETGEEKRDSSQIAYFHKFVIPQNYQEKKREKIC